jgi:hypothetical protein
VSRQEDGERKANPCAPSKSLRRWYRQGFETKRPPTSGRKSTQDACDRARRRAGGSKQDVCDRRPNPCAPSKSLRRWYRQGFEGFCPPTKGRKRRQDGAERAKPRPEVSRQEDGERKVNPCAPNEFLRMTGMRDSKGFAWYSVQTKVENEEFRRR